MSDKEIKNNLIRDISRDSQVNRRMNQARERIRTSLAYYNSVLITDDCTASILKVQGALSDRLSYEAKKRIRASAMEKLGLIYKQTPVCNGEALIKLAQKRKLNLLE